MLFVQRELNLIIKRSRLMTRVDLDVVYHVLLGDDAVPLLKYVYATCFTFSVTEFYLWELVYIVRSGSGDNSYHAWSHRGPLHEGSGCTQEPGATCDSIYKTNRVATWQNVNEVSAASQLTHVALMEKEINAAIMQTVDPFPMTVFKLSRCIASRCEYGKWVRCEWLHFRKISFTSVG